MWYSAFFRSYVAQTLTPTWTVTCADEAASLHWKSSDIFPGNNWWRLSALVRIGSSVVFSWTWELGCDSFLRHSHLCSRQCHGTLLTASWSRCCSTLLCFQGLFDLALWCAFVPQAGPTLLLIKVKEDIFQPPRLCFILISVAHQKAFGRQTQWTLSPSNEETGAGGQQGSRSWLLWDRHWTRAENESCLD